MRRSAWLLSLLGAAGVTSWVGLTLGSAAAASGRPVFLPPPVGVAQAAPAPAQRGVDSSRVHALLQAARGSNTFMCELAANTVDGRSGWWDGNAGFRAGAAGDSSAGDVVRWVRNEKIDAASVPLLRAALSDSDWCVRRLAAPLLARIDAEPARQAMLGALAAADAGTREMGALALGFAEDLRSIQPLVGRLRDDAPRVRATAAWALGEIESREAVRPLIDVLRDPDALVRESAARALGEVEDDAAIPALTDLLKSDREPAVRRAAARALGEIVG